MRFFLAIVMTVLLAGCSAIPDVRHQPLYHNPYPQLYRVAILPFFNLSDCPHVNGEEVALAYYTELQSIPGFEVMPVGVVIKQLQALRLPLDEGTDYQQLAQRLGVDAILVGAVTEYTPYYPPRMGISVNWYAANRGYHPIPPGYGLPWGTPDEECIPKSIVLESEFALAREQLATQTPQPTPEHQPAGATESAETLPAPEAEPEVKPVETVDSELPVAWPDPAGLIPSPPSIQAPAYRPQYDPVIQHTRVYHGSDEELTQRLADYYYFRDDARFGGWQSYLQRSDDFIRFCCHLHITETLEARGGASESRLVLRWPIGRYER